MSIVKVNFRNLQIPHEKISVAEVARLRGFGCFGQPEFLQIRLQDLITFSRGEFVCKDDYFRI